MDNKVLWIGSYQSEQSFQNMLVTNIGQASSYASQKGLIKGIDSLLPKEYIMDTIGSISYPPYPTYPQKKVKQETWSRTGKSFDHLVGFLNLKYINYLSRQNNLGKAIEQWMRTRKGNASNTIIIYEPSITKLKKALKIKTKYGAAVFVVIPDIPELVNLSANILIKTIKKSNALKIRKLFTDVNGFILYSSKMAEYYNIPDNKWMLMEGVFDPDEFQIEATTESNTHPIRMMYCGVLDKYRGIPQLLDAFESLKDQDYELWLTGSGQSEELIRERMKRDNRIKYYGYLDSRNDVLELEHNADILIHTRDVTSPAAPYCFPSKVFEYLATGKPVISVRIPGIPDEYFKYMIPIEKMEPEAIKDAIQRATSLSDEDKMKLSESEIEFIKQNKTSRVQANRILRFLNIL